MGNAQLADLVRRAHEGEVLGEALFTRLASLETDDSSRKRLRAAVPDPDHPSVAQLLAHEQALNAFAQAEADGRDGLPTLLVALDDDRRRALA